MRRATPPPTEQAVNGRKRWLALLVLALLLAAAALAWYLLGGPDEGADLADASTLPEATASLADVPDDLVLEPERVTGDVRLSAEALPKDPEVVAAAVVEAWTSRTLRPRPEDDELAGAPRTASELAPALRGRSAGPAGTLELALLTEALLEAKGFESVSFGMDDQGQGGATDLLKRRYLVRVADGPWLAPDGEAVDAREVVPLTAEERLAHILAWRALGAVQAGEDDLATRAAEQARVLAPDDPALAFVAGQVQIATGLPEMGLSTMEGAARRRADARTWYTLGLAAMAVQQPAKAHQYLGRAAREDPSKADPHVLLAQLALERLQTTPEQARAALVDQVRDHVDAAREADADAAGLRLIEAQLAALNDDLEQAEALLEAETEAHPESAQSWLVLAQFLEQSGRERQALEVLREAADSGVEGPGVHKALGSMLVRDGRLEEAGAALRRALEIDPADPDLRPQLAQIRKALGRVDEARDLLEEHLELAPGTHDVRLLLAQLEMDAEELGPAGEHIEAVLDARPRHREATVLRYTLALKRQEGVVEARRDALEVVGARSDLASLLLEQGFLDEGETLLRHAVEQDADDAMAPVLLSMVLVGTKRVEEAERVRDETLARVADEESRARLEQQFEAAFRQAREARRQVEGEESDAPALPTEDLPDPEPAP